MVAPFFLRLLGPPGLCGADGEPIRLRTKKQLALMARLAWEAPRSLSRDYLIDFLWRSAEPRAARHSLAQALTALRKVLGEGSLTSAGATVALRAGLVGVDVRLPERLDGALLGRLFDGFHIPGVPAFEQWRDRVAAETWPVLREAMVRAISQARSVGRYVEVEALGRELLAHDSLCEAGIEACIQGRALAGDRVGALRLYDEYSTRLREELGTQPSDALQRAAANLRRGVAPREMRPLRVAEAATGQRSAYKPVPLVGRERSYSKIHEFWTSARQGEPQYVLIVGVPGVGKTALGMMLAAAAHAEGSAVVRLQLHETERTAPYALLAELIRQLLTYPGAAAAAGDALAELSRICPAVRERFPGVAEAPPAMPETVHLRLTEALVELLTSVTEEQPVLLLVDDIVLGDDASLVVLRRLPRKVGGRRLFVCYTSSTEDLSSVLVDPERRGDGEMRRWARIALTPLADADARLLVQRRLADVSGEGRRDVEHRVVRLGRGNPLALEMLLLDWRSYGADSLVFRADAVAGGELAPSRIPDRIRQAFERQRAMLSESAREVLDLAAVLGHRLLDLDIYAALGASPIRVTEASRQLLAAGLWSDAGLELEFRNELLRIHAYFSIPRPARVALHLRVVRVLEERIRPGDPRQLLELAWHLWRADDRHRAADTALEGSERCLQTFAPRTAERVATDFLAESIGVVERSRFRYVLGRAFTMQSRLRAAERPLREAMEDGNLDQRARTEAQLLLGEVLVMNHSSTRVPEVLIAAHSSLRIAEQLHDVGLQARSYRLLAEVLIDLGRHEELEATREQIQSLLKIESDSKGDVLAALGFVTAHLGALGAAHDHFSNAVTAFERDGALEGLANAKNGLGIVLYRLGRWNESRDAFRQATACAKQFDDVPRQAKMLSNMAAVDIVVGDYDSATSLLDTAIALVQESENARHEVVLHINRLQARLGSGEISYAPALCQVITEMVHQDSHWEVRLAANLAVADYYLVIGDVSQAMKLIAASAELAVSRERRILEPAQFLRLDAVRRLRLEGPAQAERWLGGVGRAIAETQVSSQLTWNALSAWLGALTDATRREDFAQAMERIAASGALGLLDELRWSGVGHFQPPHTRRQPPE